MTTTPTATEPTDNDLFPCQLNVYLTRKQIELLKEGQEINIPMQGIASDEQTSRIDELLTRGEEQA